MGGVLGVAAATILAHGAYHVSPSTLAAGYTLFGLLGASYLTARAALVSASGARVERVVDRGAVEEGGEIRVKLRVYHVVAGRVQAEELVGGERVRVEAVRRGDVLEAEYKVRVPYGRLRIHGPRLTLTDPLGAFEARVDLMTETRVLGLPRVEERLAARIVSMAVYYTGSLSARPGMGLAYLYSREYNPDDDARLIDWKGYARRGKPLVKIFEAEKTGVMLLVLDYTRGSRGVERAARLLAALAYAGVLLGARVRAVTISDSLYVSPWVSKRSQLPLVQATLAEVEEGLSLPCEKHVQLLERILLSTPHPPALVVLATSPCSLGYSRVLGEASTRSRILVVRGGGVRLRVEAPRVSVVDAPGFQLDASRLASILEAL